LEDVLSQIETPILDQSEFWLFNQLVFDTPLLGHFIRRTEIFTKIYAARVRSDGYTIWIYLFGRDAMDKGDGEVLSLGISCKPLDWQLSALTQVLGSFLSSLATLESLEIAVDEDDVQDEIEDIQGRELLHPFITVKQVTLDTEASGRLFAHALQELSRESPTQVLPALQDVFLHTEHWQPSGPVKEAIGQFTIARQRCNHPVAVHYWDSGSRKYMP
jgi:hypothetical protein